MESQVCTPLPEQRATPGTHTPEHAPVTQAFGQALAVPQDPVMLQVSTPLPAPPSVVTEHRVSPGEQTPVHMPDWHTEFTHAIGLPHCPAVHVCTA